MTQYEKVFKALKHFLLGRRYMSTLRALEFARSHHPGMRKDKVTPSFFHQLEICMFLTTLKDIENEEMTLTVALLHDTVEDTDVSLAEISLRFGKEVADCVWLLTKKHKDQKKDYPYYFAEMAKDPVASLVKGSDRISNLNSMVGVFSKEKQLSYIGEVEQYFLPMIKEAKKNFPQQSAAYFNIQHMLKSQVRLVKAIHDK